MRIGTVPIEAVDEPQLAALIGARESIAIEFKSRLPSKHDDEVDEFIADLSAFANTQGGVVIYGCETGRTPEKKDTGIATQFVSLNEGSLDADMRRLQELLHANSSPSLFPVVRMVPKIVEGKTVLLVGISQSLHAPHRTVGTKSFWRRGEGMKYEPGVEELRHMFSSRDRWVREAETFHRERLDLLASGHIFPAVKSDPFVLADIVPLDRLDALLSLDALAADQARLMPLPRSAMMLRHSWMADGLIACAWDEKSIVGYGLVHRNGTCEGHCAEYGYLRPKTDIRVLDLTTLTQDLYQFVLRSVKLGEEVLGVARPLALFVTLRGFMRHVVPLPPNLVASWHQEHFFTRDNLSLPPLLIDHTVTDLPSALRQHLTMLWQAATYPTMPQTILPEGTAK